MQFSTINKFSMANAASHTWQKEFMLPWVCLVLVEYSECCNRIGSKIVHYQPLVRSSLRSSKKWRPSPCFSKVLDEHRFWFKWVTKIIKMTKRRIFMNSWLKKNWDYTKELYAPAHISNFNSSDVSKWIYERTRENEMIIVSWWKIV